MAAKQRSRTGTRITSEHEGRPRFTIGLGLRHPWIDPAEVTSRLKLEPLNSWKAGEPRRTPTGILLEGTRSESMWVHAKRFAESKRFTAAISALLDELTPHRDFFQRIVSEGGSIRLSLHLPGDVNIGDDFEWQLLARLAELHFELTVEVFPKFGSV